MDDLPTNGETIDNVADIVDSNKDVGPEKKSKQTKLTSIETLVVLGFRSIVKSFQDNSTQ